MCFYVNWLDDPHDVAVVRTFRPGLLERHLRPGQQMAALCSGTPKYKFRQDGSQQGPIPLQLQSHTCSHTFGLAGVDPSDRSALVSPN
jgi:hypothetical protein